MIPILSDAQAATEEAEKKSISRMIHHIIIDRDLDHTRLMIQRGIPVVTMMFLVMIFVTTRIFNDNIFK